VRRSLSFAENYADVVTPAHPRLNHVPRSSLRFASFAPSTSDEVRALENLASTSMSERYRARTQALTPDERLDRALSRTEDLMLFFISMCREDEGYMQVRFPFRSFVSI
jgi:hypothetical protein